MLKLVAKLQEDMKIIVVLDNLDRLDSRRLRNAWDSMQLFVNYMNNNNNPEVQNTWLVIQYRIPKPFIIEWEGSLTNLIKTAFSTSDEPPKEEPTETEVSTLISVLNCYLSEGQLDNPREQKKIINEHVSLKKMYPKVSIQSIAVFLYLKYVFRQEKTNQTTSFTFEDWITDKLSQNTILPPSLNISFEENQIAMMTFGVREEEKPRKLCLQTPSKT